MTSENRCNHRLSIDIRHVSMSWLFDTLHFGCRRRLSQLRAEHYHGFRIRSNGRPNIDWRRRRGPFRTATSRLPIREAKQKTVISSLRRTVVPSQGNALYAISRRCIDPVNSRGDPTNSRCGCVGPPASHRTGADNGLFGVRPASCRSIMVVQECFRQREERQHCASHIFTCMKVCRR
jgi:hypothetical protein